jgi:uncharacterized protein (DUF2147 family)
MSRFLLLIALIFSTSFYAQHSIVGKWKTIDDETGKVVSVVEIYEAKGKFWGKIVELTNPKDRDRTCVNCEGSDHNKPILGLTVIKGLSKVGNEYTNGKILDPKHGKLYKSTIALESKDRLKVRGYIGVTFIGRTQIWERVK